MLPNLASPGPLGSPVEPVCIPSECVYSFCNASAGTLWSLFQCESDLGPRQEAGVEEAAWPIFWFCPEGKRQLIAGMTASKSRE